jgi:cell division protein FtsL
MVCRSRNCKNKVEEPKKVSRLTSVFLLVAIISVAGIVYIMQVNKLATMGYEIKLKESKIDELEKKNERLKIRAAELKSMNSLEVEKERMQMRKPDEISYIEVDEQMAVR